MPYFDFSNGTADPELDMWGDEMPPPTSLRSAHYRRRALVALPTPPISGVHLDDDLSTISQIQSSSSAQIPSKDGRASVVPEAEPPIDAWQRYAILSRYNMDKEVLSEQPSVPGTFKRVSIEEGSSPQVQTSRISGMLGDMETTVVSKESPAKNSSRLNKGKERARSEQPRLHGAFKRVAIEAVSPQVQTSQISKMLADMETAHIFGEPVTRSRIQLGGRALSEPPSPENQGLPNRSCISTEMIEPVPLFSETHTEAIHGPRSPTDHLFGNGLEFRPYHRNRFDIIGIWVERKLATQICWWPWRSPVPPNESGLTQMLWKCGCGSMISTVISNEIIMRYHSPSASAGNSSGSVRTMGTPQVLNQLPTRPSAVLATQGRLPPIQQITTRVSAPSSARNIIGTMGTFILCCVRKQQHRTVLVQMDNKSFVNDREFFRKLRAEYRRVRGWKWWISPSFVVRIKFVKFTRYYLDYVDCQEPEQLPPHTNSDYEYIPKPPDNPPVLPVAEFMHYFERPDCAGTATDCLDLMPKRVIGPLEKGRRVEGWGLQPMEGLSVWKFISLLVLVWLGTLAFAAWWLVEHPNDFQNAFVPATYAAAFAAIGVILPGVLRIYK